MASANVRVLTALAETLSSLQPFQQVEWAKSVARSNNSSIDDVVHLIAFIMLHHPDNRDALSKFEAEHGALNQITERLLAGWDCGR